MTAKTFGTFIVRQTHNTTIVTFLSHGLSMRKQLLKLMSKCWKQYSKPGPLFFFFFPGCTHSQVPAPQLWPYGILVPKGDFPGPLGLYCCSEFLLTGHLDQSYWGDGFICEKHYLSLEKNCKHFRT